MIENTQKIVDDHGEWEKLWLTPFMKVQDKKVLRAFLVGIPPERLQKERPGVQYYKKIEVEPENSNNLPYVESKIMIARLSIDEYLYDENSRNEALAAMDYHYEHMYDEEPNGDVAERVNASGLNPEEP